MSGSQISPGMAGSGRLPRRRIGEKKRIALAQATIPQVTQRAFLTPRNVPRVPANTPPSAMAEYVIV
jgi:hypothetical protein